MTGFARTTGNLDGLGWAWEARSVNGKNLDVRLRLAAGFERLEQTVRAMVGSMFKRGNFQVSLEVREQRGPGVPVVNEDLLDQLLVVAEKQRRRTGGPPVDIAALLNIRGVVDVVESHLSENALADRDRALLAGLDTTLLALETARQAEGARLAAVIEEQLARIESLVDSIRGNPARRPEAVRERLAEQVQRLMDSGSASLDAMRLHQEAVLLATKSDIQEEIDRLSAHVAAARKMLGSGEAAGRKLEFLMQEFNREANTLCAKSSDIAVTATGLELKVVIDQMREQALNIE